MESAPATPILIWATDPEVADALVAELAEPSRDVRVLEDDAQLASSGLAGSVLVAQAGARLDAQRAFLRGPIIVLAGDRATPAALATLARQAYAVVTSPAQAGLAVDRLLVHRTLAEQAAGRRGSPRRCARCGRGFDSTQALRGGTARRFVRFGSIALCGGCVELLRTLLRKTAKAVVEADA